MTLDRLLNRPIIGWLNAALQDVRVGIPVLSTILAYRIGVEDPQECIAAGMFVGVTVAVTNLLLYARLDRALETQSWDEVLTRHPQRHARIWAEANGQVQEYRDALEQ